MRTLLTLQHEKLTQSTLSVEDGIATIEHGDHLLAFDVRELRAALEAEALEAAPTIAGGRGSAVGRR